MSRIFISGGSGLLGTNWACAMRDRYQIVLGMHSKRVELRGVETAAVDLQSVEQLNHALQQIKPDVVVHTAGLTNVDACERDLATANAVNAVLAGNVASACQQNGIKLIHISTDHLFDGSRAFYKETDTPAPLNNYAISKLNAETEVSKACPSALIVRTNFFGWGHHHRTSFSDWVIASLRAGNKIRLFDDVYFTPVLIDTLADLCHRLVEVGATGSFNVVSDTRLSKYEFGRLLAEEFGLPGDLLLQSKLSESGLSAARPHDMSLDNSKLKQNLGMNINSLAEQLHGLKNQDVAGRAEEIKNAIMEN